jgi:hypothetical protein
MECFIESISSGSISLNFLNETYEFDLEYIPGEFIETLGGSEIFTKSFSSMFFESIITNYEEKTLRL